MMEMKGMGGGGGEGSSSAGVGVGVRRVMIMMMVLLILWWWVDIRAECISPAMSIAKILKYFELVGKYPLPLKHPRAFFFFWFK